MKNLAFPQNHFWETKAWGNDENNTKGYSYVRFPTIRILQIRVAQLEHNLPNGFDQESNIKNGASSQQKDMVFQVSYAVAKHQWDRDLGVGNPDPIGTMAN